MRLYGVRIFVDEFEAARAFYAGTLALPVAWEIAERGVLGLWAGEAQLIVETVAAEGEDRALAGRFVGVSLQVEDIHASHRALADKGVGFTGPPEQQFWGGWLAHFRDPAGNTLTLLG